MCIRWSPAPKFKKATFKILNNTNMIELLFKGFKFISCTEIIGVEMISFLFPSTKPIVLYKEKGIIFILYMKEVIFLTL